MTVSQHKREYQRRWQQNNRAWLSAYQREYKLRRGGRGYPGLPRTWILPERIICKICGQEKPINKFRVREPVRTTGYRIERRCFDCRNRARRQNPDYPGQSRYQLIRTIKLTCSKCGAEKDRSEFYRRNACTKAICKICQQRDSHTRYEQKRKKSPWLLRSERRTENYIRRQQQNNWVMRHLLRMARDDGLYDLLKEQWEREHGKRPL